MELKTLKSLAKFVFKGFWGRKETQRFYNDVAEVYESAMKDQRLGCKRILNTLPEGKKGLDIGCGTGLSSLELMAKTKDTVGVDFSKGMLEKAKEKNIPYLTNSSILRLPFKDCSFDRACAVGVLRHLPQEKEEIFFNELYRVLETGGWFVTEAVKPSVLDTVIYGAYDFFMKTLGYNERLSHLTVDHFYYLGKQSGFSLVLETKLKNSEKGYVVHFIK